MKYNVALFSLFASVALALPAVNTGTQKRAVVASPTTDTKPLKFDNVTQFTGYLEDEKNDTHLFYWFFESRSKPSTDPIVIWFSGGPGGASIEEAFDIGPAVVARKNPQTLEFTTSSKALSWNNFANLLFIDQPYNVGFSFSKTPVKDSKKAAHDIHASLTAFFKKFPQYSKQPVHLTGSSFAGHWIPAFASEILTHNDKTINLKSVSIGNGFTDPLTQWGSNPAMACGKGGYPSLAASVCKGITDKWPTCEAKTKACYADVTNAAVCKDAYYFCFDNLVEPVSAGGTNAYDIRKTDDFDAEGDPKYIGFINAMDYLGQPENAKAIGAHKKEDFVDLDLDTLDAFRASGDVTAPYHQLIPDIVKQIPVLVYAGDADFICNWIGVKQWMEDLKWDGKTKFNQAELKPYTLNGKEVGKIKGANGLTFVKVAAAGHQTSLDQPEVMVALMKGFLNGKL
ncbi:hypothetical protein TWF694_000365 [Orbilia ellipsospora]|uniref:carboxypeptidase C n=1 Tax=Orbilia ellipsospora TaxID=2528407 RepID=A0AAV9XNG1_9PEZI